MQNFELIKLLQKFPPAMPMVLLDMRHQEETLGNLYPLTVVSQLGPARKNGPGLLALEITDVQVPGDIPGFSQAVQVALGLLIINRAAPGGDGGYHVRAEHDNIYAGSLEWATDMSDQDKATLEALGWTEEEDVDGWRYGV